MLKFAKILFGIAVVLVPGGLFAVAGYLAAKKLVERRTSARLDAYRMRRVREALERLTPQQRGMQMDRLVTEIQSCATYHGIPFSFEREAFPSVSASLRIVREGVRVYDAAFEECGMPDNTRSLAIAGYLESVVAGARECSRMSTH